VIFGGAFLICFSVRIALLTSVQSRENEWTVQAVQCDCMNYFTPPTPLVFDSALDLEECERRLREAIDIERPTIFSLSSYRGSKPFLGKIGGRQIRILQRTYGRNAFSPVFSGEFQTQAAGTKVIGKLDLELTSKIAICLLSTLGILVLIPIIIYSRTLHPLLSAISPLCFSHQELCVETDSTKRRTSRTFLEIRFKQAAISDRS
jgi:hypothetical protein